VNVAVLAGGRTPERDVSLRSGHRVMGALEELGHRATVIDPGEVALAESLIEDPPDLCYLTLHGKEGEDGTIQRLLDVLGIGYTAFDKLLAKDALRRADVRTPSWAPVEGSALRDLGAGSALARVSGTVGSPCLVKPSRSGSALGVSTVRAGGDLAAAVMHALSFSGAAIVEAKVSGVEVAVGVIGDGEALPAVEIRPKSGTFDYAARYTAGATDYFAPARLSETHSSACREAALASWKALRLRDVTRVDMIVDETGEPWVLDVNVSPGMTETSLLPMGRARGA
jgi:D-alanine-D-alanine ligase